MSIEKNSNDKYEKKFGANYTYTSFSSCKLNTNTINDSSMFNNINIDIKNSKSTDIIKCKKTYDEIYKKELNIQNNFSHKFRIKNSFLEFCNSEEFKENKPFQEIKKYELKNSNFKKMTDVFNKNKHYEKNLKNNFKKKVINYNITNNCELACTNLYDKNKYNKFIYNTKSNKMHDFSIPSFLNTKYSNKFKLNNKLYRLKRSISSNNKSNLNISNNTLNSFWSTKACFNANLINSTFNEYDKKIVKRVYSNTIISSMNDKIEFKNKIQNRIAADYSKKQLDEGLILKSYDHETKRSLSINKVKSINSKKNNLNYLNTNEFYNISNYYKSNSCKIANCYKKSYSNSCLSSSINRLNSKPSKNKILKFDNIALNKTMSYNKNNSKLSTKINYLNSNFNKRIFKNSIMTNSSIDKDVYTFNKESIMEDIITEENNESINNSINNKNITLDNNNVSFDFCIKSNIDRKINNKYSSNKINYNVKKENSYINQNNSSIKNIFDKVYKNRHKSKINCSLYKRISMPNDIKYNKNNNISKIQKPNINKYDNIKLTDTNKQNIYNLRHNISIYRNNIITKKNEIYKKTKNKLNKSNNINTELAFSKCINNIQESSFNKSTGFSSKKNYNFKNDKSNYTNSNFFLLNKHKDKNTINKDRSKIDVNTSINNLSEEDLSENIFINNLDNININSKKLNNILKFKEITTSTFSPINYKHLSNKDLYSFKLENSNQLLSSNNKENKKIYVNTNKQKLDNHSSKTIYTKSLSNVSFYYKNLDKNIKGNNSEKNANSKNFNNKQTNHIETKKKKIYKNMLNDKHKLNNTLIDNHFNKYNLQSLYYNSNRTYSNLKIDPEKPLMERIEFYKFKYIYKKKFIESFVKNKIPKISILKEKRLTEKLVSDSIRREKAHKNINAYNSNISINKHNNKYFLKEFNNPNKSYANFNKDQGILNKNIKNNNSTIQKNTISDINTSEIKNLLKVNRKTTDKEWNIYLNKNIINKNNKQKLLIEGKRREKEETLKSKEDKEIKELERIRNKIVSKAQADSIFNRLSLNAHNISKFEHSLYNNNIENVKKNSNIFSSYENSIDDNKNLITINNSKKLLNTHKDSNLFLNSVSKGRSKKLSLADNNSLLLNNINYTCSIDNFSKYDNKSKTIDFNNRAVNNYKFNELELDNSNDNLILIKDDHKCEEEKICYNSNTITFANETNNANIFDKISSYQKKISNTEDKFKNNLSTPIKTKTISNKKSPNYIAYNLPTKLSKSKCNDIEKKHNKNKEHKLNIKKTIDKHNSVLYCKNETSRKKPNNNIDYLVINNYNKLDKLLNYYFKSKKNI